MQDIINWNTAQESNDTRLRISVSIIKALGSLVGATYQPVIIKVLKEQEETIGEIHQRFMLGARHNVSVDKDRIFAKTLPVITWVLRTGKKRPIKRMICRSPI
ncbi:MAG: hypothetical protein F6K00_33565 [Leptolyngbya sp. SIOISBB]|nr:hypothetical protein [Leptolyngbya sp. SIOISBB]